MRIVTWNVANRRQGRVQWEYLQRYQPDIVFLQECRDTLHYITSPEVRANASCTLWECVPTFTRPKGVAILTKNMPLSRVPTARQKGRVLAATVETEQGPILLVSVHVETTGENFETAKAAFHAILEDVRPILMSGMPAILGGDLNLTVHWSADDVPVRDRLVTEFGFTNCNQFLADKTRFNRDEVSTLRGRPHQDDYFFTRGLGRIQNFDVLADESLSRLSDHHPLLLDVAV
jgi:exonuclease III